MDEVQEEKLAVIIEDDADVRHLLKTVLTQSGFQTILTSNGPDGIEAVRAHNPVLTTLDVSMPGMDGFAVAKRIREFSGTYVVMLTALADEIDIVQGLDSGADDYLLKPFRPRELRARIDTLLRRPRERVGVSATVQAQEVEVREVQLVSGAPNPQIPMPTPSPAPFVHAAPPLVDPLPHVHQQSPHVQPVPVRHQPAARQHQPAYAAPQQTAAAAIHHTARQPVHEPAPAYAPPPQQYAPPTPPVGGVEGMLAHRGLLLDTQTRLTEVDGQSVELTRSEFDLLATLLGSGRRVRSKADLVLALRGESYVTTYYVNDADKRAVEVHMANLRRKIGDSSATPRFIETVRGVGYRLASERDAA